MNIILYLADILKLTVAGILVFIVAWFFVRNHLDKIAQNSLLQLKQTNLKETLSLRLQAYERVILFLERINPTNMLIRLHNTNMTATEMQQVILTEIRAEFQHNMTQQLYISNHSWTIIKKMMEDTIGMVNNTVNALPDDASALSLSKTILSHLDQLKDNPYEMALAIIKRDMQQLF